jgi:predicted outer membrane protein
MYRTTALAACFTAALGFSGAIAAPGHQAHRPANRPYRAYTAGQLEVEAGKQALDKSKNENVCAFAQRISE